MARLSPELVALLELLAVLVDLAAAAEAAGEYPPCAVCPYPFLVVQGGGVVAPVPAAVVLAVAAPLTEEGEVEKAVATMACAGKGHLVAEMAGC